jgi:hypothetical protein
VGPEEVSRRRAALKHFRELLETQRDRFRDYLAVLDKEQDVIANGNTEALLAYVEMEEHIVKDIFNIQKVIDPLESLYRELSGCAGDCAQAEEEEELGGFKAAVERLRNEAVANATRNRELLAKRMTEISAEITSLRGNPYAARRSIYADNGTPLMIDMQG